MVNEELIISTINKERMLELFIKHRLPISQALAYHLICELEMRPCDAARLVGVSQVAITDARAKALKKMKYVTN